MWDLPTGGAAGEEAVSSWDSAVCSCRLCAYNIPFLRCLCSLDVAVTGRSR